MLDDHEVDDRLEPRGRVVVLLDTLTDDYGAGAYGRSDARLVRIHSRDAHHGRRPQPYGIVTAGDILCDLDRVIERELLDERDPRGLRIRWTLRPHIFAEPVPPLVGAAEPSLSAWPQE